MCGPLGRGPGGEAMCRGPEVGECLDRPDAQWVWSRGRKRKVVGGGVGWRTRGPAHTGPAAWCVIFGFCSKKEMGARAGFSQRKNEM